MAELNVQPKRRTPWWLWLLLLLIIAGLLYYFLRGKNQTNESTTTTTDTTITTDSTSTATVATTTANLDSVDFNAPSTNYEEVTDTTITVQSGGRYTIYSIGGNVLFAKGQSTLQKNATNQLKQVSASLQKRFNGAIIGIFGHADATGDAAQNKELGTKRAEAVRDWLINNGNIAADKISIHSYGESQPLASNATAKGRQQNRSVEIVAIPDSAAR